jgi:transposase
MGSESWGKMAILGGTQPPVTHQESGQDYWGHLWEILNSITLKVSNGPAEGSNSRIIMTKVRSIGFRNKQRFANAIYFHLGGLDLYPESATS